MLTKKIQYLAKELSFGHLSNAIMNAVYLNASQLF